MNPLTDGPPSPLPTTTTSTTTPTTAAISTTTTAIPTTSTRVPLTVGTPIDFNEALEEAGVQLK